MDCMQLAMLTQQQEQQLRQSMQRRRGMSRRRQGAGRRRQGPKQVARRGQRHSMHRTVSRARQLQALALRQQPARRHLPARQPKQLRKQQRKQMLLGRRQRPTSRPQQLQLQRLRSTRGMPRWAPGCLQCVLWLLLWRC